MPAVEDGKDAEREPGWLGKVSHELTQQQQQQQQQHLGPTCSPDSSSASKICNMGTGGSEHGSAKGNVPRPQLRYMQSRSAAQMTAGCSVAATAATAATAVAAAAAATAAPLLRDRALPVAAAPLQSQLQASQAAPAPSCGVLRRLLGDDVSSSAAAAAAAAAAAGAVWRAPTVLPASVTPTAGRQPVATAPVPHAPTTTASQQQQQQLVVAVAAPRSGTASVQRSLETIIDELECKRAKRH
jgi:hypothetical protein